MFDIGLNTKGSPLATMTSSERNVEDGNADSGTPLLQRASSQHSSLSQTMSGLLHDWWLYEILGAAIAVLAILAIGVILVAYDSSSLPDWPSVFTVRQCFIPSYTFTLLNSTLDQLGCFSFCYYYEALHGFCCRGSHKPVKMALVPSRRASPPTRLTNVWWCD